MTSCAAILTLFTLNSICRLSPLSSALCSGSPSTPTAERALGRGLTAAFSAPRPLSQGSLQRAVPRTEAHELLGWNRGGGGAGLVDFPPQHPVLAFCVSLPHTLLQPNWTSYPFKALILSLAIWPSPILETPDCPLAWLTPALPSDHCDFFWKTHFEPPCPTLPPLHSHRLRLLSRWAVGLWGRDQSVLLPGSLATAQCLAHSRCSGIIG